LGQARGDVIRRVFGPGLVLGNIVGIVMADNVLPQGQKRPYADSGGQGRFSGTVVSFGFPFPAGTLPGRIGYRLQAAPWRVFEPYIARPAGQPPTPEEIRKAWAILANIRVFSAGRSQGLKYSAWNSPRA